MVQLGEDELVKLKCCDCGEYLSCSPVFIKHNGDSICGRCTVSDQSSVIRNTPYETIAEKIEFPCRNRHRGCKQIISFAQLKQHEQQCQYQEYSCPIVTMETCEWRGSSATLVDHCKSEHPKNVVEYPCTMQYDTSKDNVQTFLTSVFNVIFLIHVKVCLASGKIFHCVRFFENQDDSILYQYNLDVTNNDEKLIKKGNVVPFTRQQVEEHNSLSVNIAAFQEVFETIKGVSFSIILKQIISETKIVITEVMRCASCRIVLKSCVYKDGQGWKCVSCAPKKMKCHYCNYYDVSAKIQKHFNFFCNACSCMLCNSKECNSEEHLKCRHSNITHTSETFCITPCKRNQYSILNANFGTVICRYETASSDIQPVPIFTFKLFAQLHLEELSFYKCALHFTNKANGKTATYYPELTYTEIHDWCAKFEMKESDYNGFIDVKVEFTRN